MNNRKQTIKYITFDVLTAMTAWCLFFAFRKVGIGIKIFNDVNQVFCDHNFWWGLIIIPLGWVMLYTIIGAYRNVLRKSRLKELGETLVASIIGVVVLFFSIMLDDDITSYKFYYASFLFYLVFHFVLTYVCRLCITTQTVKKIHSRQIGFPTLLIGSGANAYKTYLDVENQEIYTGNAFVGFVSLSGEEPLTQLTNVMPHLGTLDDMKSIVEQQHIEEAIIAVEDNEQTRINQIIRTLSYISDIIIKITPDARDLTIGNIKVDNVFHSPLVVINNRLMSEWQYSVKRISDIFISLFAMLILSPVYLITAIIVKFTSPGPIFYAQERIGHHGKPFKMHKFRSMYIDAESAGPALSKDDDPRITPFGKFMRKVRLDEIPQFYNVLKGTMSLVGPRPERQFYIDQIVQKAPEYVLLHRIKPGITSWGQVKYGYASSVDEMVERLRYDLLYLENMSLATDIKILLYTVLIIFEGRGK